MLEIAIFTLQDVELNELRATIGSLRQQNYTHLMLDNGRCQSPVGSSSGTDSLKSRHHYHHHQQQQHHRSADNIKTEFRKDAPGADDASNDHHSTKKHKSWVRLVSALFLSLSSLAELSYSYSRHIDSLLNAELNL